MHRIAIEEVDAQGRSRIFPNKIGVLQGSAVSPLLANIYLDDFCQLIQSRTPCKIISYADDFVILHREPFTQEQLDWIAERLEAEGLKLNSEKTRCVNMRQSGAELVFLGFSLKNVRSYKGKKLYIKIAPSKKSQKKFKEAIRKIVKHRTSLKLPILIALVNRIIRGWKNYFGKIGYPRKVFFKIDWFVVKRFYLWSRNRSQRKSKYLRQNAWEKLAKAGLIYLQPTKVRMAAKGCR